MVSESIMPHSTSTRRDRSRSTAGQSSRGSEARKSMEKFPDMDTSFSGNTESDPVLLNAGSLTPVQSSAPPLERCQNNAARAPLPGQWTAKQNGNGNGARYQPLIRGHGRQKSLSEAYKTLRTRKASVSEGVHEIAEALKAPVSWKLVAMCGVWYFSSAMTNTSSKTILTAFPKPATLTMVQFAFVSGSCILLSYLSKHFPSMRKIPQLRMGVRPPTKEIIITTLPLALFQIGGHLLSSSATQRIPVSLVHTIKGLSPLFTVFAYRFIYSIKYPTATYLSLIPLTLGVMLACSASLVGNFTGILYAFLAAIIFVTQNIFAKRLFNEAKTAEEDSLYTRTDALDKLNLLCYSSGLALVLTAPIWLWSEGFSLIADFLSDGAIDLASAPKMDKHGNLIVPVDHGRLVLELVFNGIFHFGQNIIAFILLSMTSPVTYSVASLIKRVVVVVAAMVWFRQTNQTSTQYAGIALTFFGLYLYDRTGHGGKAERKAKLLGIQEEPLLPMNAQGQVLPIGLGISGLGAAAQHPYINGIVNQSDRRRSDSLSRRARNSSVVAQGWLPPGTRAEETWKMGDAAKVGDVKAA